MITVEHLSGMGEALKELRWQARMKQVEVCRATGLTAPQVSRYENGHEMPTVESLVKYLGSVGADLCDLQSVLVTGQVPERKPAPARPDPAAEQGGVDRVREEGDRRLESSSSLRQAVGTLLSLNIDGMERLEHRMKSMEEWMEDLSKAGEEKKRAAE